jgi:putative ABC transport system substrate-binding protein
MKPARLLAAAVLTPTLVVAPLAAHAQPSARISRIGVLVSSSPEHPEGRAIVDVFRQALRARGHAEGRSVAFEYRWAEGRFDRFPALAAELVRARVDVIVAPNTPAARAAKQATSTVPIVAWAMQDPAADGLVASLARPGGNVTGLTFLGPELVPKRLELLKEALPGARRVAALWHPGGLAERTGQEMLKEAAAAARALGVQLQVVPARAPGDLGAAFSAMRGQGRADALITFPSGMLFLERRQVVDLAARHRLPAMYNGREFAEAGGLMAYGANIPDLVRRSATFVDRILKGAKPAELPVEQPTTFELVINLKTATALGLTIPPSVLGKADEVIR